MKLIGSKITIPTEPQLVCRQELLDTLRENLESCHATIIDGRAGTGKTMLAVDFVRRYAQLAAWYKVDAPDMSLPAFIEYLVASVATVRPGLGCQALQRLAQSHETGRAEGGEFDVMGLAEAFVYDLERQAEPLVLVIDYLHLIYGADWVTPFFHRLLPLLPAGVHMLIVGRGLLRWLRLDGHECCLNNEQHYCEPSVIRLDTTNRVSNQSPEGLPKANDIAEMQD